MAKRKRKKKTRKKKARRVDLSRYLEDNAIKVLKFQKHLALSGTIVVVGLGLVGTHQSTVGGYVVVVGLVGLMWSIHRYGRLGTERV